MEDEFMDATVQINAFNMTAGSELERDQLGISWDTLLEVGGPMRLVSVW